MAKIVRDVDEHKVQDYKEDIDTLLVFVRFFRRQKLIQSSMSTRPVSSPLF